jgi:integrase
LSGLFGLGYLAAVNTGLRRKELASVQWGDMHLDADRPFILVRSATTKNRKGYKIYLRSQLARLLVEIKPGAVVHHMAALIFQWNSCRLEVGTDHFHRRHTFRKHRVFRLEFSSDFQLFQFRYQFGMQWAWLFFAILDEGSGQHPIRIGRTMK